MLCNIRISIDREYNRVLYSNKHAFWTTLDRVQGDAPKHEQLFVLMDTNARTGSREKGQVQSDTKLLGAYGRDTLNDNY